MAFSELEKHNKMLIQDGINDIHTTWIGKIYDVVGNPGVDKVWNQRLMYMPLPTTALDKNKNSGMNQNPGY